MDFALTVFIISNLSSSEDKLTENKRIVQLNDKRATLHVVTSLRSTCTPFTQRAL